MSVKLSRREREIMDILFELGEVNAREILDQMSEPPGYSAIRAMLAKLVQKGSVQFRQDRNRYLYSPTVARAQARESALKHLVKTFFDNSPALAANALLGMDGDSLDPGELARLRAMVDQIDEQQEQ
jgi:BlaI family penicillinase repressor